MKLGAMVVGLACGVSLLACGSQDDAADDDAVETTEGELRTSGVLSLYVSRGTGFRPPPPAGQCHPSGHWTVDFAAKTLKGDACLDSEPVDVDRILSTAEVARVRAALSKVRAVSKPTSCPTDMPVNSLTVTRARSEAHYVDQRAACGAGGAVKEAGLASLVDLLEELSAVPPSAAPCVRTGCSGQLCADSHRVTTCQMRPEYACYRGAICERDAAGRCGFRQTPTLLSCLGQ